MSKKAYIGVGEEYTVLDYIQSSGTQYIDTGFKPNQDTRVTMDLKVLSVSNATTAVFGQRNETNAQDPTAYNFYIMQSGSTVRSDYFGNNQTATLNIVGQRVVIDKNKNICTVGGTVLENSSANGQGLHNLYLLTLNDAGKPVSTFNTTAIVYSCKIYDNGILVRDFVPVRSASGAIGLYDRVFHVFYENKGSGSFTAGSAIGEKLSTSGVARLIKKGYIGVDGVARKIKKAYVGVGGIARRFFGSGTPGHYGTITDLSACHYNMGVSFSAKNHALFMQGWTSSSNTGSISNSTIVDAYNASLTKSNPTANSYWTIDPAGTVFGDYAILSHADSNQSPPGTIKAVETYDASLTKGTAPNIDIARRAHFATHVGNCALIGGGYYTDSNGYKTVTPTVNAYNSSLTKTMATNLPHNLYDAAAASNGKHTLLFGNDSNTYHNDAVVYDASLTQTVHANELSTKRYEMTPAVFGDYMLLACGRISGQSDSSSVDVFDSSLTRMATISVKPRGAKKAVVCVEDYAFFASLRNYASYTDYQDYWVETSVVDSSLTVTKGTNLGTLVISPLGASVGNYAIFAGGQRLASNRSGTLYYNKLAEAFVVN